MQISPYYNFLIFVKGILFPGPGNIDVHCNSIGFGKGKGKRKILQSTPGPGIHYNSIGFGKGKENVKFTKYPGPGNTL